MIDAKQTDKIMTDHEESWTYFTLSPHQWEAIQSEEADSDSEESVKLKWNIECKAKIVEPKDIILEGEVDDETIKGNKDKGKKTYKLQDFDCPILILNRKRSGYKIKDRDTVGYIRFSQGGTDYSAGQIIPPRLNCFFMLSGDAFNDLWKQIKDRETAGLLIRLWVVGGIDEWSSWNIEKAKKLKIQSVSLCWESA